MENELLAKTAPAALQKNPPPHRIKEACSGKEGTPGRMPPAYLLAGGRGSRLRPLTDPMPKPLLPVSGVPLIVRILSDLNESGVQEAVVLTGYRGEMIEDAIRAAELPISVRFVREETPLGSFGALAQRYDELPDVFFVLCADSFGKRDYRGFYEDFRKKNAVAGILLARVTDPTEYGLAQTDGQGMIRGFMEKPAWSTAFTDLANTGTYLFKKEILKPLPEKYPADVARDLFPRLFENGLPVSGYEDGGFWCDVGTPADYLACCLRENGGKSVVSENAETQGAIIGDSVVFGNVRVGKGSAVRGAILAKGCRIGENCLIPRGCVLGEECVLEDGVKLPENTVLPPRTLRTGSENETASAPCDLRACFTESVFYAPPGADGSVWKRVGDAYATAAAGGSVACGYAAGEDLPEEAFAALRSGIACRAQRVIDLGKCPPGAAELYAQTHRPSLTLFLSGNAGRGGRLLAFDETGLPVPIPFLRRVRDELTASEKPLPQTEIALEKADAAAEYAAYLGRFFTVSGVRLAGVSVGMALQGEPERFFAHLLLSLGASVNARGKGDLQLSISPDGARCRLQDGSGILDFFHVAAFLLQTEAQTHSVKALPFRTPEALFAAAAEKKGRPAGFPLSPHDSSFDEERKECAHRRWLFDASAACAYALAEMRARKLDCRAVLRLLPAFSVAEGDFDCPANEKLSFLIGGAPAGEGVSIPTAGGTLRLRAKGGRGLSLQAEAGQDADARDLLRRLQNDLLEEKKKRRQKNLPPRE